MSLFPHADMYYDKSVEINWDEIKCVILDVDGTLYDLFKMRLYIIRHILSSFFSRHLSIKDLRICMNFRNEREKRAFDTNSDLDNMQYDWAATASGVSTEKVREVINKWFFEIPMKYMHSCVYPGVHDFFEALLKRGIKIAVCSDYPAMEKLHLLDLRVDCLVSSTDIGVGVLKPHPKGLMTIMNMLSIPGEYCLFIGDRDDRDGECARRINMKYLILRRKQGYIFFKRESKRLL
ncbi:MAG: HAD hydrolase-like protein [Candidatus Omnitrophica bacterium]|nr:HAD hydrolase-like protein [Candidatus Omnitrophota bacterium]